MNVAVADALACNVTVQFDVPVQAPDQPANVEPESAVAVRVTEAPPANVALQDAPQLIPDGLLVMVPLPVPARCAVS